MLRTTITHHAFLDAAMHKHAHPQLSKLVITTMQSHSAQQEREIKQARVAAEKRKHRLENSLDAV